MLIISHNLYIIYPNLISPSLSISLLDKHVALSPALQSQPLSATAVAPPSVAATEVLSSKWTVEVGCFTKFKNSNLSMPYQQIE